MSPNLIAEHDKILHWPDSIDMDSGHFIWLQFTSNHGRQYRASLEDYHNEMAMLYIRDELSDKHIASYVLSFTLTPPPDFGSRIPQVESAYVDVDYQLGGVSTAAYKAVIEHYGAVISDTHQTEAGMLLWLFGITKDNSIEITLLTVVDNELSFKTSETGARYTYQGDIQAMQAVASIIWGNPDNVELTDPLHLGFRPTWDDRSNLVLAAMKKDD